MQPVQYFIEFDQWSKKIKAAKNNPIEKIEAAKKLIDIAHLICQRGYQKELKKIFNKGQQNKAPEISEMYTTWSELLDTNLMSLELAADYCKEFGSQFSMTYSVIEMLKSKEDEEAKKLFEKEILAMLKKDDFINKLAEGVLYLAKATIAPYEMMMHIVRDFNEDSYLLKEETPINLN